MAVELPKRPLASKELQDWLRGILIAQDGRGYGWCLTEFIEKRGTKAEPRQLVVRELVVG